MKTCRIVLPKYNIDISMPSWLFWFFKRAAVIHMAQPIPGPHGTHIDMIVVDESQEWAEQKTSNE